MMENNKDTKDRDFQTVTHAMIAWGVWFKDITICWVSSLGMLCQACFAAIFGLYLFRGLFSLGFLFSIQN